MATLDDTWNWMEQQRRKQQGGYFEPEPRDPIGGPASNVDDIGIGGVQPQPEPTPVYDSDAAEAKWNALGLTLRGDNRLIAEQQDAQPEPDQPNAFGRGWEQLKTAGHAAVTAPFGIGQEGLAESIAEDAAMQQARQYTPEEKQWQADIAQQSKEAEQAEGFWNTAGEYMDVAGAALSSPSALGTAAAESAPMMLPSLIGGAGAGALAGSFFGPVGTALGALAGMTAGTFGTDFGAEYANRAQEEVVKRGLNPNDKTAVASVLGDEKFNDEALPAAAKHAGAVAGTDLAVMALTGGLGSKAGRSLKRSIDKAARDFGVDPTDAVAMSGLKEMPGFMASIKPSVDEYRKATSLPRRVGRNAALMGLETAGEGGGEALGQYLADGEIDAGDVVLESLLGGGMSMAQVAAGSAYGKAAGRQTMPGVVEDFETLEKGAQEAQAKRDQELRDWTEQERIREMEAAGFPAIQPGPMAGTAQTGIGGAGAGPGGWGIGGTTTAGRQAPGGMSPELATGNIQGLSSSFARRAQQQAGIGGAGMGQPAQNPMMALRQAEAINRIVPNAEAGLGAAQEGEGWLPILADRQRREAARSFLSQQYGDDRVVALEAAARSDPAAMSQYRMLMNDAARRMGEFPEFTAGAMAGQEQTGIGGPGAGRYGIGGPPVPIDYNEEMRAGERNARNFDQEEIGRRQQAIDEQERLAEERRQQAQEYRPQPAPDLVNKQSRKRWIDELRAEQDQRTPEQKAVDVDAAQRTWANASTDERAKILEDAQVNAPRFAKKDKLSQISKEGQKKVEAVLTQRADNQRADAFEAARAGDAAQKQADVERAFSGRAAEAGWTDLEKEAILAEADPAVREELIRATSEQAIADNRAQALEDRRAAVDANTQARIDGRLVDELRRVNAAYEQPGAGVMRAAFSDAGTVQGESPQTPPRMSAGSTWNVLDADQRRKIVRSIGLKRASVNAPFENLPARVQDALRADYRERDNELWLYQGQAQGGGIPAQAAGEETAGPAEWEVTTGRVGGAPETPTGKPKSSGKKSGVGKNAKQNQKASEPDAGVQQPEGPRVGEVERRAVPAKKGGPGVRKSRQDKGVSPGAVTGAATETTAAQAGQEEGGARRGKVGKSVESKPRAQRLAEREATKQAWNALSVKDRKAKLDELKIPQKTARTWDSLSVDQKDFLRQAVSDDPVALSSAPKKFDENNQYDPETITDRPDFTVERKQLAAAAGKLGHAERVGSVYGTKDNLKRIGSNPIADWYDLYQAPSGVTVAEANASLAKFGEGKNLDELTAKDRRVAAAALKAIDEHQQDQAEAQLASREIVGDVLTQPTPEDLAEQKRQIDEAKAAESKADKKQQVDAGTADFTLTGLGNTASQVSPNNEEIPFSFTERARKPAKSVDPAALKQRMGEITGKWKGLGQVDVVATENDLPAAQKAKAKAMRAKGAEGVVQAVYMPGKTPQESKIILVAENIGDMKEAGRKIAHEAVGHHGLRMTFPNAKLDPLLNEVADTFENERAFQDIVDNYKIDMQTEAGRLEAADEYIAHLAETKPNDPILKRIYAAIRAAIRAAGFNVTLRDVDLNRILRNNLRAVQRGTKTGITDTKARGEYAFAGPKSVTADQTTLEEAKALDKIGAPDEAIRRETGWSKGADKKWRYEIDDSKAKLKTEDNVVSGRLGDVLDHPELFAAYPELAEKVWVNGQHSPEIDSTTGSLQKIGESIGYRMEASGKNSDELLGAILHETQHGIQNVEGFAGGGNTRLFKAGSNRSDLQNMTRDEYQRGDAKKFADQAEQALADGEQEKSLRLMQKAEDAAAFQAYLRLAGETEARNVQTRQGMSAEDRVLVSPRQTQDTADAEQIVVEDEGVGELADGTRFSFGRKSQPQQSTPDPFEKANRRITGQDKTVKERINRILKRQLTAQGNLPDEAFGSKVTRDSLMNSDELDIRLELAELDDSIKSGFGKPYRKLDAAQKEAIGASLTEKADFPASFPDEVKTALGKMRKQIDSFTVTYSDMLFQQIQELKAEGKDAQAAAKVDLLETLQENLGVYMNRSYQMFDDPKWRSKLEPETINAARAKLTANAEAQALKYDGYADKADDRGEHELADRHRQRASDLRQPRRVENIMDLILAKGESVSDVPSLIREGKLGQMDQTILMRKKDIEPEIRALMGEYTDPFVNYATTRSKLGRLIFNQKFLNEVRAKGLMPDPNDPDSGFLFKDPLKAPQGANKKIATGDAYSPIDGLYTFPEIEQAFRDALGKEQMAEWYRTLVRFNGMVKYGKTVLSPPTAIRNFVASSLFPIANGHFDMRHTAKAFEVAKIIMTERGESAAKEYWKKLLKLGVIYDSPYAQEMRKFRDEAMVLNAFSGEAKRGVAKALEWPQRVYSLGDDWHKVVGFENEKALQMKYHGLSEADAEVAAAERIRNTYPTYSMTGRAVNTLRRFPLMGTFVSFPAEIIRTTYHILRYAAEDMRTPGMRPLAMRRIAGIATVSSFAAVLQSAMMDAFGVDDDEEEAVRTQAAPWNKNSNIMPIGRNDEGHLQYLDLSFLDSYNYFKRPLNAILRDQPFNDKATEIAREVLSPFFGIDIAAQNFKEIFDNRKDTGGRVFNPEADPVDQAQDIAKHLVHGLQPGVMAVGENIAKGYEGHRTAGKQYNLKDETMAAFGLRVTTNNPKTSLSFAIQDFKDDRASAMRIVKNTVRDPNEIGSGELRDSFDTAMRSREKVYRKMLRLISAARKNGLSRRDIMLTLKDKGVSKYDVAKMLRGEIPSWRPSRELVRGAARSAGILHGAEIARMVGDRARQVGKWARER